MLLFLEWLRYIGATIKQNLNEIYFHLYIYIDISRSIRQSSKKILNIKCVYSIQFITLTRLTVFFFFTSLTIYSIAHLLFVCYTIQIYHASHSPLCRYSTSTFPIRPWIYLAMSNDGFMFITSVVLGPTTNHGSLKENTRKKSCAQALLFIKPSLFIL